MANQLVAAPLEPLELPAQSARSTRGKPHSWGSIAVFIVALAFFFFPWVCAAVFGFTTPGEGFTLEPLTTALSHATAITALKNTLLLTLAATFLMLTLVVPTIVFLNLKAPGLAKIAEVFSILPMVIPAVALVSGVSEFYRAVAPAFVTSSGPSSRSTSYRVCHCVTEQLILG